MENKIKITTKIFFWCVSFAVAFALWYFNTGHANDFVIRTFNNIPVKLINLNVLNEKDLTLANDENYYVNLQFRGTNNNLNEINRDSLRAEADLADISSAGEQNLEITVSGFEQNVILEQVLPNTIRVDITDFSSSNIVPEIIVQGSPKEGLEVISAKATQEVTLDGPQSELDRVKSISGVISVNGMSEDSTEFVELQAYDTDGNVLNNISISPDVVQAEIVLGLIKEVEILPPKVLGETNSQFTISKVSIDPNKILIAGKPKVIEPITTLSTREVSIPNTHRDSSFSAESEIIFPQGVTSISEVTKVKATVEIEEIVERHYTVTNLTPQNLGSNLTTKSINPGSVSIEVRGTTSELQKNDASKLTGFLNLNGLNGGKHKVTVDIPITSGQITSIEPAQVEVEIVKKNS